MFKKNLPNVQKGGEAGVKGVLNNVKKTARLVQGGFPYSHALKVLEEPVEESLSPTTSSCR